MFSKSKFTGNNIFHPFIVEVKTLLLSENNVKKISLSIWLRKLKFAILKSLNYENNGQACVENVKLFKFFNHAILPLILKQHAMILKSNLNIAAQFQRAVFMRFMHMTWTTLNGTVKYVEIHHTQRFNAFISPYIFLYFFIPLRFLTPKLNSAVRWNIPELLQLSWRIKRRKALHTISASPWLQGASS